ncbi:MAG: ABC transporter ATP-binding protein [Lachnospiraceae bacterium]|nr:ABC transporter ATP-binding protein [Lachnospiraceae bacterium]
MLKIEKLKKAYGKYHALDGLDMTIEKGALYGFVGPNGAGKTTTIKILAGLLNPDSGTIRIDGVDAGRDRRGLKGKIGYVPDSFGVYDNLKVREYMEFFASCYGIEGLMARKRCGALLEQVGLENRADFYVDGLSRGMQQRLCLARALIHDPALLVMDEPSSGLDPKTRLEFKELVQELNEEGKTILISSHVLSELAAMCTDIGIIDQGRMVLCGSMKEIMERVDQSNPLLITVYSNMETAMAVLRSHSCVRTISIKENCLSVGFTGDAHDEALLLQQLVDADVLVNGFSRMQGNLESLFMQITDREDKEVLLYENKPGL